MNFLKFLQLLFCCFIPKIKKAKKIGQKIPNLKYIAKSYKRHRTRRSSRDTVQALAHVRTQDNYHDLKKRILNSISFDSSSTIIVWCPENLVPNDYISTMLHGYGKIRRFLDRWIKKDDSLGYGTWSGAVVQYAKRDVADFVIKDLSIRCKHIKILALDRILPVLADCELMHFSSGDSSFKVLISGRKALELKDASSLYFQLFSYGQIQELFLNNKVCSTTVICEVTYPFLTQAYLATVMTEGLTSKRNVLFARIEGNERNDEILADVRNYFMMAMGNFYPCHFF